jgi:hypothetical protein
LVDKDQEPAAPSKAHALHRVPVSEATWRSAAQLVQHDVRSVRSHGHGRRTRHAHRCDPRADTGQWGRCSIPGDDDVRIANDAKRFVHTGAPQLVRWQSTLGHKRGAAESTSPDRAIDRDALSILELQLAVTDGSHPYAKPSFDPEELELSAGKGDEVVGPARCERLPDEKDAQARVRGRELARDLDRSEPGTQHGDTRVVSQTAKLVREGEGGVGTGQCHGVLANAYHRRIDLTSRCQDELIVGDVIAARELTSRRDGIDPSHPVHEQLHPGMQHGRERVALGSSPRQQLVEPDAVDELVVLGDERDRLIVSESWGDPVGGHDSCVAGAHDGNSHSTRLFRGISERG